MSEAVLGFKLFYAVVKCVPQSARISSRPLKPTQHFLDTFITGAKKLPKSFLSGNPSKMLVKSQYKFLTRLIVAVHVIC